jgi:hypothetical protein
VLLLNCVFHFSSFDFVRLSSEPLNFDRYEIDKVTAGQRLDLNLERG